MLRLLEHVLSPRTRMILRMLGIRHGMPMMLQPTALRDHQKDMPTKILPTPKKPAMLLTKNSTMRMKTKQPRRHNTRPVNKASSMRLSRYLQVRSSCLRTAHHLRRPASILKVAKILKYICYRKLSNPERAVITPFLSVPNLVLLYR